jgi:hypothetical protein
MLKNIAISIQHDHNELYKNYTILRVTGMGEICNLLKKLVELKGIEPSTS